MLTSTFRQTREMIGERRQQAPRRALTTLGEVDRRETNRATNMDGGDGHHHRMFANLVAAAWVGTLMTSAYYVFNHLLAA
jgi:carbonic anhydrase